MSFSAGFTENSMKTFKSIIIDILIHQQNLKNDLGAGQYICQAFQRINGG
jgi:hypothetical protein